MVEQAEDIKPVTNLTFEKYESNGWEFYHANNPMLSAKELDQISDKTGTMGMPEVVYGNNRLYIVN